MMILWHQDLIPYLNDSLLMKLYNTCCYLRSKGWKIEANPEVQYVFTYSPEYLTAYHYLVIDEMNMRNFGINDNFYYDCKWLDATYRGKELGYQKDWADEFNSSVLQYYTPIFNEHNQEYYNKNIKMLTDMKATVNWETFTRGW